MAKLSTNCGMNLSTEFRVLSEAILQLNNDSLNEYSGLIKLLNDIFEFLESPLTTHKKNNDYKFNKGFQFRSKKLN